MSRTHTLPAVCFLAGLAGGLILLATSFLGGEGHLETALKDLARERDIPAFLSAAEGAANQDLDRHHFFIQLYGGVQRLTGRRMVEDMNPGYTVVKLNDGSLTFGRPDTGYQDVTPHAEALADWADYLLETRDLPLAYIQVPAKAGADDLPAGIPDFSEQDMDEMLGTLDSRGVTTLDLRSVLEAAAAQPGAPDLFFRTDHHWTPATAFLAYQAVTELLREQYGFAIPEAYTDPDSYEKTTLEDWFLGSQGKRVGTLYAGVDDIELWSPKFETSFNYSSQNGGFDRTGPFDASLVFPERVAEKDYFNGNPYTYYAGGDYTLARIVNHLDPDGPRVLLLRDSYACAMTPFLALNCGELDTIDLRYFQDDLMEYVDWLDPDLVLVMYGAGSTHNNDLFSFLDRGA